MSNNILTGGQTLIVGDDSFDPGVVPVTYNEIVSFGGVESVWSGGVTYNTEVLYGGAENVLPSGVAVATSIYSNGVVNVSGGILLENGVNTAEFASTFDTQVYSGGVENVDNLGVANDSQILGGVQNVNNRGVASYTSVGGGQSGGYGFELVYSGGVSNNATVGAYGVEDAYAGGVINNATVQAGGTENVFGAANGTLIEQGGDAFVYSGGVAHSADILGGVQTVYAGGAVDSTYVGGGPGSYGFELVDSGGVSNGATVGAFGVEDAYLGGVINNATILGGGTENVFGAAYATLVEQGGDAFVYSGGVTNSAIVLGGVQTVYAGGAADSTYVGGNGAGTYGFELVDAGGVSNGATVGAYGVEDAYLGGVANHATVLMGGTENVFGVANSSLIGQGVAGSPYGNGDAEALVYSGGVANNSTLDTGLLDIYFGGVANGTTIDASSVQNVYGVATDTTINGGSDRVFSGGVANGSVIGAGVEYVYANGASNNATVLSGGAQDVFGVSTGTTINQGGAEYVYSGATASNVEINGGTLDVYQGGQAAGTTTFESGGFGNLVLQQSTQFAGSVSGFGVGDTFDLQDIAYYGSNSISYNGDAESGILSIGTGSQLADIQLLGNYVGATFAATGDGHGGTSITETLAGLATAHASQPSAHS